MNCDQCTARGLFTILFSDGQHHRRCTPHFEDLLKNDTRTAFLINRENMLPVKVQDNTIQGEGFVIKCRQAMCAFPGGCIARARFDDFCTKHHTMAGGKGECSDRAICQTNGCTKYAHYARTKEEGKPTRKEAIYCAACSKEADGDFVNVINPRPKCVGEDCKNDARFKMTNSAAPTHCGTCVKKLDNAEEYYNVDKHKSLPPPKEPKAPTPKIRKKCEECHSANATSTKPECVEQLGKANRFCKKCQTKLVPKEPEEPKEPKEPTKRIHKKCEECHVSVVASTKPEYVDKLGKANRFCKKCQNKLALAV